MTGDLASVWSKLEEAAARLALVHFLTRWAGGEEVNPALVDEESMQAGITLARWFGNEARRVYAILDESDNDREDRHLVEWIERKGGSVTARELQQGRRKYRLTGQAEAALEELAKADWGKWHSILSGPKGGRPSREFRLSTVSTSTQPPKTLDSEGFVDVDSVDAFEVRPDDE